MFVTTMLRRLTGATGAFIFILMQSQPKSPPPFTMKVITKRHGKQNPIDEGAGMLRVIRQIRQIRGEALIPKGVYRFKSMEEANRWMIHTMASTHVRLFSKM